ncbi:MAG: ADP-ribosylation/crystallin J1 [Bacteroidia bacterium]
MDTDTMGTTTLYRPVGPQELALIEESDWTAFPPRLEWQPIFYPVMNEEYAIQIARDWNVPESGSGYVTRFEVDSEYLSRFEVQNVGGSMHEELWVPAEELAEFNRHIVGRIVVTQSFFAQG